MVPIIVWYNEVKGNKRSKGAIGRGKYSGWRVCVNKVVWTCGHDMVHHTVEVALCVLLTLSLEH